LSLPNDKLLKWKLSTDIQEKVEQILQPFCHTLLSEKGANFFGLLSN
jgi:hypothetical protein